MLGHHASLQEYDREEARSIRATGGGRDVGGDDGKCGRVCEASLPDLRPVFM
jgi:hypothetical protein